MKKRYLAALMAIMMFSASVTVSFAENDTPAQEETESTSELTTASQKKAEEKVVDVDEDIRADIEESIPKVIQEIKISTADEFLEFARNCSLDTWSVNKKVVLMENISLLGKDFGGIPSFGGYFDGQGHTISEVNISKGLSYAGLFTYIQKGAVVESLNVTGIVQPDGNTTIIGGIAGDNCGTIHDCSFKGIVCGNDYIGGIVGINELTGSITSCRMEGFISGMHFIGGIAGKNDGNLANCRNDALVNTTNTDTEITIDSFEKLNSVLNLLRDGFNQSREEAKSDVTVSDIGGIAGVSIGIISHCINNGEIGYDHVGYNVGGIAGRQSGYVLRCSNNGKVKGRKDVGGIVGQAEPFITVDLSSDVAFQLQQAVEKLHDSVTVTLKDAKSESDTVTNRLAVISRFTAGAIDDTRYLAAGTVDFANGVTSATTEAFSRIDYILDEASKNGGPMDNTGSAMENIGEASKDIKKTVGDIDIEKYIRDEDELRQYRQAKLILESASAQYSELTERSKRTFYNLAIMNYKGSYEGTTDLQFVDSVGNVITDYSGWSQDNIGTGTNADAQGKWQHGSGEEFPVSGNSEDTQLHTIAQGEADSKSDAYARENYVNPVTGTKGTYTEDIITQTSVLISIYEKHLPEMTDAARVDAQNAMNDIEAAASDFRRAGAQTKDIVGNIAGRSNITFPQFSSEYKAHTASLADNMQGMNDNFGLLASEIRDGNGVLVDDLLNMSDQFTNILELYTDAIDGVLEKDYTNLFTDESYTAAEHTTDATIDSCFNFGECEGDIDCSGIAGTMAIEYDFDKESDITGNKDNPLNTSYLTKCVLRDNRNYGDIKSLKNYAGGVCGLQEMGTIIDCGSYAKVISTSGNYVGGVAGSSISHIVKSYAKGELDGNDYVGGITGDGKHIRECLTIVTVGNAKNWYGAIAGHVAEDGEVRDNYFVSDDLCGIDRVSYTMKAEPIRYDAVSQNKVFIELEEETEEKHEQEPVYRELPYEFSNLKVTFILEDEDLEGGSKKIGQIYKEYGQTLSEEEYPSVDPKEGNYVVWDIDHVDKITCDITVKAGYKRYRTTIAEDSRREGFYQSELLVDGSFKEDDRLEVTRDFETTPEMSFSDFLDNYEILTVKVPDDGNSVHQIRFRLRDDLGKLSELLPGVFKEQHVLYLVKGDERIRLEKTGTMGGYSTYDIEGNEFVVSIGIYNSDKVLVLMIAALVAAVLLTIIILIIVIWNIRKHSKKLPKALKELKTSVSEKIENKEQLFYDDSQDDILKKEIEEYKKSVTGQVDKQESQNESGKKKRRRQKSKK